MNETSDTLSGAGAPVGAAAQRAHGSAAGRCASVAALERMALLQGLAPALLERLAQQVHVVEYERGQWVLRKGQAGQQLLFLFRGQLQVVDSNSAGQEVGLNFIEPGEHFGELSVIDALPRTASVLAVQAAQVGQLARAPALELIYQQPLVAERMLRRLALSVRKATALRGILALPQAAQRVCALLVQMTRLAPGGLPVVEPLPRQREVAIMINTSRETVSRTLQWLQQQGVVERDLRRLIVRRPQVLQQAAHGGAPEGGAAGNALSQALGPADGAAVGASAARGAQRVRDEQDETD